MDERKLKGLAGGPANLDQRVVCVRKHRGGSRVTHTRWRPGFHLLTSTRCLRVGTQYSLLQLRPERRGVSACGSFQSLERVSSVWRRMGTPFRCCPVAAQDSDGDQRHCPPRDYPLRTSKTPYTVHPPLRRTDAECREARSLPFIQDSYTDDEGIFRC